MIVDTLLDWLEAGALFLASILPQWDIPAFLSNFGLITSNLAALNYFLPLSEVFGLVLGVFYMLPLFLGSTVTLWVYAQVRGSASRG